MVWRCFSYNEVSKVAIIHGTFKSELCVNILKENIHKAVRLLKLSNDYIF